MSDPIVQVKQGKLKGKRLITRDGMPYFGFLGVPYAEPPEGKLRFKDPIPIKPWQGIKDAIKEGNKAAQFEFKTLITYGSDDCLYLNVFTPRYISQEKLLPVMFFIHGGGFVEGSGTVDDFGPDYIVEQNTVFVSFNYRLGVMGFLCTDSINARGDMGLKDQNMALRWVQENIKSFGGDPDNVTIFGVSAGSASVEYHILSPKSKGLFHKAIMQSGTVLNPWGQMFDAVDHAERLAKLFGYKKDGGEDLFEFINKIETSDLVKASVRIINNDDLKNGILFGFGPVINKFEDYDGFLNEEPQKLLQSGRFNKVPCITGFNELEGLMMIKHFYHEPEPKSDLEAGNYFDYLPDYLNKSIENCDLKLRTLYKKTEGQVNEENHMIHYLSDLMFTGGIFYSFEQRLKNNQHSEYFYYFTYDGNMNLEKLLTDYTEIGASHADEIGYLAPTIYHDFDIVTPQDWLVKDRLVKFWTNFARTGNPSPKVTEAIDKVWLPATIDQFQCIEIGTDLQMHKSLIPERRTLWKDLYSNF